MAPDALAENRSKSDCKVQRSKNSAKESDRNHESTIIGAALRICEMNLTDWQAASSCNG